MAKCAIYCIQCPNNPVSGGVFAAIFYAAENKSSFYKGKKMKIISGTFVDGIAWDIPSNNFTASDWAKEFDQFKKMGMDSVIIIRAGFKDHAMFNSEVIKPTLYEDPDLIAIMLNEAQRTGLKLYMGLYETVKHGAVNDWENEAAVNADFADELLARYGNHPAFYGWYMSYEADIRFHPDRIWKPLCQHIRKYDKVRPIIASPRYSGRKYYPDFPVPPAIHAKHFDYLLGEMEGMISAYAFMDGHTDFKELGDYAKATYDVFQKHGVEYWSNVETFDRDMRWKFPPIEWMKLRYKIDVVQPYVEKLITFEAPHFLSPNSQYMSARNLYRRYMEYIGKEA